MGGRAGVAMRSSLVASAVFILCTVMHEGEAYVPLHVDGKGGFWNQIVIGKDKAYHERIGGLTIKGVRATLSLVDRETPTSFAKRWDITSSRDSHLAVFRGKDTKLMSLDTQGNAMFTGKMKVDGVLRVKTLALDGVKTNAEDGTSTLTIGTDTTSSMRLGSNDQSAWVQSDKNEPLVLNPRLDGGKTSLGVTMFSEDEPKHTVDAHGDLYVESTVRLGETGKTTLESNQLTFAMGGGWTSMGSGWISSLKTKPVQFGGAVFGTRLGVGIEVTDPTIRLEVHNGHFVVTSKIGNFLKGLTTYVMPEGSHMKAYDYTRKKLQKWRITGTRILLNPDQKSDGRVCIGCESPEHHLQSEGNMYVNGNVFVNKHLHVEGHMHIDKIVTPEVLIHSRIESPEYGRGIMIGNDLPNKWGTKSNMRLGYNEKYAWVQSHKQIPLVINPQGGGTCIGCKAPSKDMEVEVEGNAFVNGELYVATLKEKEPMVSTPSEDSDETFSLSEAKSLLETEMGASELNVMSAWSSATKILQDNHRRILKRESRMKQNEEAIRALEVEVSSQR